MSLIMHVGINFHNVVYLLTNILQNMQSFSLKIIQPCMYIHRATKYTNAIENRINNFHRRHEMIFNWYYEH